MPPCVGMRETPPALVPHFDLERFRVQFRVVVPLAGQLRQQTPHIVHRRGQDFEHHAAARCCGNLDRARAHTCLAHKPLVLEPRFRFVQELPTQCKFGIEVVHRPAQSPASLTQSFRAVVELLAFVRARRIELARPFLQRVRGGERVGHLVHLELDGEVMRRLP